MGNFEHEDTCLKFSRIYGTQFAPAIYAMAHRSIRLFFSTAPQGALFEQGAVNQNTHFTQVILQWSSMPNWGLSL